MGNIRLLPESTANQIAAGEVVQRPASVVKELMENAVDAGATEIQLYVSNGGATFIQVDDNGKGMSAEDAMMCWERHATSKISKAEDLYDLHTLGFRGEALASIASVSDTEMKTILEGSDVGTRVVLSAGRIVEDGPIAHPAGTSITVKNLFYNIPARKNFLKSISVETKHILEEFQRIALAYPDIAFRFHNQGKLVMRLERASLKQRIADLFGLKEEELIGTDENTDIVGISGFVGAPKRAKKTRGQQYLFANGRYIRDPYLNHAISSAYAQLIDEKSYPFYTLFLSVDPAKIDVNIHPTKHEVKLEDGRHVYQLLQSAVKRALSAFYQLPTELDLRERNTPTSPPSFKSSAPDSRYNPFEPSKQRIRTEWEKLDELLRADTVQEPRQTQFFEAPPSPEQEVGPLFQWADSVIAMEYQGELWLINQHRAHEQVLYERFRKIHGQAASQQLLFPRTLELDVADHSLFHELQEPLRQLGFDLSDFGKQSIIVNGLPAELSKEDGAEVLLQILEDFKQTLQSVKSDKREALYRAAAKNAAIKAGTRLKQEEIRQLVNDLLHCEHQSRNAAGLPIVLRYDRSSVQDLFK